LLEVDELAEPGMEAADALAILEDGPLALGQGLEVAPGAEDAVGPGDDHRPDVVGVAGLEDGLRDPLPHLEIEGVAPLGAVEPYDERRTVALTQDEICHGLNPRLR